MGLSPTVAGLLGSVYGALQLFSNPLVGRWSDSSGRRRVLLYCLLMSSLGYACLGLSVTVYFLLFSRIILGVFKCSQEQCRSYLADSTPRMRHSQVFGRFNSVSSLGFIVGPAVGGHIAELPGGFYICAFLCAAIFFLNYLTVWLFIPELAVETSRDKSRDKSLNPFSALTSFGSLNLTQLWDIFLVRFLIGLGIMVYRNNFNMWLDYNFGLSPTVAGYLTSYTGLLGTLSGFGVAYVASFYAHDTKLLLHTGVIQMTSIIGLALVTDIYGLILCMAPLSLANACARVASTNVLLARGGGQTSGQTSGSLLGVGASVLSLARMAAPALGGVAQEFHSSGPVIMGAVCVTLGVIVMFLSPNFNLSVTNVSDLEKQS